MYHNKDIYVNINYLADGYTIERGIMKFIFPEGAFFANPSSPYGVYMFEGEQPLWKLEERDAIVLLSCTPPPADYFSYRSYLFSTFNGIRQRIVFASLGDSINNLVVNTTGLNIADPFGKTTVVTTTADVATDNAVRKAFTSAGVRPTAFNTDIVPSSLVRLGKGAMTDTFTMLHRVAIFQNPEQGQAYVDTVWPVIRVRAPPQQIRLPFSTPPLRQRGTGITENSLSSSFSAFVDQVDRTVQRELRLQTNERFTVSRDRMNVVPLEGFECIEELTNCLGDNRYNYYGKINFSMIVHTA